MRVLAVLIFSFCIGFAKGQQFTAGSVYYGQDSLIEYWAGNLPIILSAPHGGYEEPSGLPDRNCVGCVTCRDSYTQELTNEIAAALIFKTGCYPHVVINKLHRKKLDANREIIEATDSHISLEPYWHDYMNFIDSAKNQIISKFEKGLFLDIHGHGHSIQRIELGFLLSGIDLRNSDSLINLTPLNLKTSILNLRFSNRFNLSHSELIRGSQSFGSLLHKRGFPSVPSDSIPYPLSGEPYFNGGYNTRRFGSFSGGTIDAIQIENNWDIRSNTAIRQKLADSLAETILDFLEIHYFNDFNSYYCQYNLNVEDLSIESIRIYPNPAFHEFYISGLSSLADFEVISLEGSIIKSGRTNNLQPIKISENPRGIYFLKIKIGNQTTIKKIILC